MITGVRIAQTIRLNCGFVVPHLLVSRLFFFILTNIPQSFGLPSQQWSCTSSSYPGYLFSRTLSGFSFLPRNSIKYRESCAQFLKIKLNIDDERTFCVFVANDQDFFHKNKMYFFLQRNTSRVDLLQISRLLKNHRLNSKCCPNA